MYVDTRGHCWVDKIEMAALWGKANACSVFGRLVISITQKNEMTQYSGRQTKRTNVTAKYTDNAQNSVTTKAQVIVTNEMHGSNNCSECIALPCWRVTYFFLDKGSFTFDLYSTHHMYVYIRSLEREIQNGRH